MRRYPDLPSNHERNLVMARKDAQTNQRLILAVIGDIARPAHEIETLTGISAITVRRHLRFMHAEGRVHIGRWYRGHIKYDRMWLAGAGKDAPKPEWLTVAQRAERARERLATDPEAVIRLRERERRRWIRRRAPRPDPAAAWMTNGR